MMHQEESESCSGRSDLMTPRKDATDLLVDRARCGDRQAFDELVARQGPHLESVLRARLWRTLQRWADLEDVLQETYLRAWRSIRKFQPGGEDSFFRWLSGIAVKVVLEASSGSKKETHLPLDLEFAREEPSPSKALQREERFERLRSALDALSPDYREVLALVRLEGLSITETAKRMGRSSNAVSKLLLRALRKLRQTFGDTESLGLPERPLEIWEDEDAD